MDAEHNGSTDEPGWEVDPEDEQGAAVVAAVGRQLRVWREAAGLRTAEFAARIGYGEDLVYKVESGKRIPRPEYLDKADEALQAGGRVSAMKRDMEQARYPKRVRDLAKMEAKAVEVGSYSVHTVHGLFQTEEHARALFEMRQPPYSRTEIQAFLAARMARKVVFDRDPAPSITLVQEEATLRRRIGGKMVWRRQLEHLAEVAEMRNIALQIMPLDVEIHAGMHGGIEILKFADGSAVGRSEGAFNGRPVSHARDLRILELRYGMIRAQALTPRESLSFIEHVLGET
ncbi:helix-turn-helix domain-containing protein [Streptomyces sp. NPDC012888]|uniref:helix-turn-helix domain-containing protein n=1 Tax=Streptomyces sp. NPDC012888 TaxID=3364855 RepID=UPI00368A60E5